MVALALASAACTARTNAVTTGTDRAVGADGHVQIERAEGGNFLVTVTATNLAPPARLGPGLTVYVVWFQARDQQPQRVGTLAYDEDSRTGEMNAMTVLSSFAVVVSAEIEADVPAPSYNIVFRDAVEAPPS
jgi:hypothetical protein